MDQNLLQPKNRYYYKNKVYSEELNKEKAGLYPTGNGIVTMLIVG